MLLLNSTAILTGVFLQAYATKRSSFLKTFNVLMLRRVSVHPKGATQETRPFSTFRNVHEEDTASLGYSASPQTSCLSQWTRNILSTVQEVPNTFLIIPPDAASCTATMAGTESSGGRMFFWSWGSVLYLVSLSGATQAAKSQMGRLNQGSNIRTQRQNGPKISRRLITTCPEAEGETPYCSPRLPPPPLYPHYLRDGLTPRAACPGSVSGCTQTRSSIRASLSDSGRGTKTEAPCKYGQNWRVSSQTSRWFLSFL